MALIETALVTGSFGLGLAHAFEVDHMTAVSAFVASKPRPRDAAVFGAKWAVGHGFSLLIFGSALYALKLVVSPTISELFERAVGVALLALGIWTLYKLRRALPGEAHHHHHFHRVDDSDEAHARAHALGHAHTHSHDHSHGALWMGVLHGLAGTAAFAGQAIVVASQSYLFVLAYTLSFSVGVLLSMAAFGGVMGAAIGKTGRAIRLVQVGLSLWACGVGVFWLLGFGS